MILTESLPGYGCEGDTHYPRFENQIAWASSYFVKTGYLDSPSRGIWRLTDKGKEAHLDGPDIDSIYRRVAEMVLVQFKRGRRRSPRVSFLLCRQHCIPDSGRTSVFEPQSAEVELALVDPAEQFDAGDRDRRRPEPFESEHRTDAKFHATVVLLDQVIQIFR